MRSERPDMLGLQEVAGNRAVSSLLAGLSAPPAAPDSASAAGSAHPPAAAGGGAPVDSGVRSVLEPLLGASLTGVRVHADETAAGAARLLGARAFTIGEHVWLGNDARTTDVRLMGHEIAHVIQQRQGGGSMRPASSTSLEAEARATGDVAAAGTASAAAVTGAAPVGVQKDDSAQSSEMLPVQIVSTAGGVEILVSGMSVAIVTDALPGEVRARAMRTASPADANRTMVHVQIAHPAGSEVHYNSGGIEAWAGTSVDVHVESQDYPAPIQPEGGRPLRLNLEGVEAIAEEPPPAPPPIRATPPATRAPAPPPRRPPPPSRATPPPAEPTRTPAPQPPPMSGSRADLLRRIEELEDEVGRMSMTPEALQESQAERDRLLRQLDQPAGAQDLTDTELEAEVQARREYLLDRRSTEIGDDRVEAELEEMEREVASRTPPPPPPAPPPPDPQIERLLQRLREGRWDVDDLAAQLTDDQMRRLRIADRVGLIRHIARGYLVQNEDEQTIIRLLRTTPQPDLDGLMTAMTANDSALLDDLESAVDFDDYREYHILLANLRLAARTPTELQQELADAPSLVWSDPGPIRAAYTYRSYIEEAEITDDGRVRIVLWSNIAMVGMRHPPVELDPMQLVRVHFPIGEEQFGVEEGGVLYIPAIGLLSLRNKQFKGELQLAADVAAMAAGGVGVAGAATRLGRAIAAAELAFGAADIAVRDFRSRIGSTPAGRAFLDVWSVAQVLVGIYGLGRAAVEAPRAFRALRGAIDDLRSARHGLSAAEFTVLEREVAELADRAREVEQAAARGTPASTPRAGAGGTTPPADPSAAAAPPGPSSATGGAAPPPAPPARRRGGGGGRRPPRRPPPTAEDQLRERLEWMRDNDISPDTLAYTRREWERLEQLATEDPARALAELERRIDRIGSRADLTRPGSREADPAFDDVREQLHPRTSAQEAASQHLGRALTEAGEAPIPGYDAHHIIPTALERAPNVRPELGERLQTLRERLRDAIAETGEFGSGINSARNGVRLPRNQQIANETGSVLHIDHIHYNNNGYIAALWHRLGDLEGADFLRALEQIKREMASGDFRF